MQEFLHIEDDDQYVEQIKDILHAYYPVATKITRAHSLQQGLDILRNTEGENVRLVLLDLGLMDTSGPQSIRALFEAIPDKPVIVLTRNENEKLRVQALRAGAQDYLIKDKFTNEQLRRAVQHALLRFESQSELRTRVWSIEQTKDALQNLLCINKIGSWQMDIVGDAMQWDTHTYQMLAYSPHSLPEPKLQDYLDIVYGEDRQEVEAFFRNVMRRSNESGQTLILEHRAIINGKHIKHLCLRCKLQPVDDGIKLIGSVQDITEQRTRYPSPLSSSTPPAKPSPRNKDTIMRPVSEVLEALRAVQKLTKSETSNFSEWQGKFGGLLEIILDQLHYTAAHSPPTPFDDDLIHLHDWLFLLNDFPTIRPSDRKMDDPEITWQKEVPSEIEANSATLFILITKLLQLKQQRTANRKLHIDFHLQKEQYWLVFNLSESVNIAATADLRHVFGSIQRYLKKGISQSPKDEKANVLAALASAIGVMKGVVAFTKDNALQISVPVRLPRLTMDATAAAQPKVLIAVRDSIVQFSIRQKMQTHFEGVEIYATHNLRDALDEIKQQHYHVAIIDTRLSIDNNTEYNGVETIRRVKAINGTPIVAMLHKTDPQYRMHIAKAGAYACVATPPHSEELLEILPPLLKPQN